MCWSEDSCLMIRQLKPSELGGTVVATAEEGDILVGDHRANEPCQN